MVSSTLMLMWVDLHQERIMARDRIGKVGLAYELGHGCELQKGMEA